MDIYFVDTIHLWIPSQQFGLPLYHPQRNYLELGIIFLNFVEASSCYEIGNKFSVTMLALLLPLDDISELRQRCLGSIWKYFGLIEIETNTGLDSRMITLSKNKKRECTMRSLKQN